MVHSLVLVNSFGKLILSMNEPIQPAGVSPPGKTPDESQASDQTETDGELSFQEVLKKARKAIDQGDKASEIIDNVNATDGAQLEKVVSQNKKLGVIFEDLFKMIDELKDIQSELDQTSISGEGAGDG